MFNKAEVFSAAEEEAEESITVAAAHERHKKREYTLDNTLEEGIPTKQAEHRLKGEDLVCPQCGDTMSEIGKEAVQAMKIIPAQMAVYEDISTIPTPAKTVVKTPAKAVKLPSQRLPGRKLSFPAASPRRKRLPTS